MTPTGGSARHDAGHGLAAARALDARRGTSRLRGTATSTRILFERGDANPNAKPKGYFRLLLNESEAETRRAAASLAEHRHAAARALPGHRARVGSRRASSSGPILASRRDRGADRRRAISRSARGRDRATRSALWPRLQRMAANLEQTVKKPRALAGEAQVRRRDRRHALAARDRPRRRAARHHRRAPTTPSISSTAACARSPTTSKRSPPRRRKRRRRCWRWWPRWKRSSRHTDTLFNSVEETASATHADGLVDQRGRSERRLPHELRHRDLVVDGGDVARRSRRSRRMPRARTISRSPSPTPRSRG